jgi:hypothetical protein
MNLPPSSDARWAEWARPLAAFLRSGPRAISDCTRFATAMGAPSAALAENCLSWLELEGLAAAAAGVASLTISGAAWVGAYHLEPFELPAPRALRLRPPRALDLRRFTYGRLHPMELVGRNGAGHALWLCACECGETCVVSAPHLRRRPWGTRSCGCLRAELWESGRHPTQWRAA